MSHSPATLEKRREYQRLYRINHAVAIAKASRERYRHLKSLGICVICRLSDALPGLVRCQDCTKEALANKADLKARRDAP